MVLTACSVATYNFLTLASEACAKLNTHNINLQAITNPRVSVITLRDPSYHIGPSVACTARMDGVGQGGDLHSKRALTFPSSRGDAFAAATRCDDPRVGPCTVLKSVQRIFEIFPLNVLSLICRNVGAIGTFR